MWFPIKCVNMSLSIFLSSYANQTDSKWICQDCVEIPFNIPPLLYDAPQPSQNMHWGDVLITNFEKDLKACYEIMTWTKNLFFLPSGRVGKEFIQEMKRLVDLFVNKTPLCPIALNALMVMVPLLLQKPSKSSKSADHIKYLTKRLELWKKGDLLSILRKRQNDSRAL